jgi:CheY-like chemotaxis protein
MSHRYRPLILAINSSQDVLNLFKELLSDEGYDVRIQSYMSHDLDEIVEMNPELVILDYMWGGEDSGWSLLQMLKLDPRTKDIPVILCTGAVQQVEPLDARLAEMGVRVVLKPFDLDELLVAISTTLQTSSATTSANAQAQ